MHASFEIQQLTPTDIPLVRGLNALFAEGFDDRETYGAQPPSDAYLAALLAKQHVIVLAALAGKEVAGGIVVYELDKFERARREIYIHDLAVAQVDRRQGIAAAIIGRLRKTQLDARLGHVRAGGLWR
jgi:aminoglycoside 3-N-acetyltransferase I